MVDSVASSMNAAAQPAARSDPPHRATNRPASELPDRPDAVELSEAARQELERSDSAPIRTELVARVREEIASGQYLTDDKLDAVVERLHEEMFAVA